MEDTDRLGRTQVTGRPVPRGERHRPIEAAARNPSDDPGRGRRGSLEHPGATEQDVPEDRTLADVLRAMVLAVGDQWQQADR